jgi:hypothetical protein
MLFHAGSEFGQKKENGVWTIHFFNRYLNGLIIRLTELKSPLIYFLGGIQVPPSQYSLRENPKFLQHFRSENNTPKENF